MVTPTEEELQNPDIVGLYPRRKEKKRVVAKRTAPLTEPIPKTKTYAKPSRRKASSSSNDFEEKMYVEVKLVKDRLTMLEQGQQRYEVLLNKALGMLYHIIDVVEVNPTVEGESYSCFSKDDVIADVGVQASTPIVKDDKVMNVCKRGRGGEKGDEEEVKEKNEEVTEKNEEAKEEGKKMEKEEIKEKKEEANEEDEKKDEQKEKEKEKKENKERNEPSRPTRTHKPTQRLIELSPNKGDVTRRMAGPLKNVRILALPEYSSEPLAPGTLVVFKKWLKKSLCWSRHIDVAFYYLRKKRKHYPEIAYKHFTTTDNLFNSTIRSAWPQLKKEEVKYDWTKVENISKYIFGGMLGHFSHNIMTGRLYHYDYLTAGHNNMTGL
ncbi:hypothetical protein L484_021934 [Morus notabilis]|uniref:Ubiquitin-like protease family profile domain-containing protein n=1 Tax=Morus notabilis TaxID=981085 RepID=W9S426_9ROSA|nr:hypothetical protein L484_021934 [Morus notabilis]